jgi:plastocyanin
MKKFTLTLLLASSCLSGFSTSWEIINVGITFSPATITIQQGDNVVFTLESIHNAVEVSQTVWDANGNSPGIGFSVPFGGGTVSSAELTVGTHYYVCFPHASLGMKGKIIVQAATGIEETKIENSLLVYPNIIVDHLNIKLDLPESKSIEIKLFNVQGKLVNVLLSKTQISGLFLRSFDFAKGIPAGIYIIKMTIGEINTYKKVIVL